MFEYRDYIYEVYQRMSFTAAARKLFISQPALSACIKKTEEKLNARLFDRSTTPIRLTEAGRAYIDAVEQIRLIEKGVANKISDISTLNSGSLSLGGTNSVFSCILPKLISAFLTTYPRISLNLTESTSEDLKEKLIRDSLELVIDYDFDENIFKTYPLKKENIYLALSRNSKAAKRLRSICMSAEDITAGRQENFAPISFEDIKNEDFLLLKKGNDMYEHANNMFHAADISPRVMLSLDQMKTSYELARYGLGIAFVTDTLISNAIMEDAVFMRIRSPHATRVAKIAHKKNTYISNCVTQFIAIAQKYID